MTTTHNPPRFPTPTLGRRLQRVFVRNRAFSGVETLVRLRWFALAGQILTIGAVVAVWQAPLQLLPMGLILAVLATSNIVVPRLGRASATNVVGGIVLLDVMLLTGLLAFSGGPANPFSVLYLVNVMLAAIMTSRRWTWLIVVASSGGFAFLFVFNVELPPELGGHAHHMPGGSYSAHLQGMWAAFTVSAVAIGVFVSRLSDALRHERERQAQTARLLGLAALAAGAAHEIGNPLGTIRLAASELERELAAQNATAELIADANLISEEVGRAKAVLDRMAAAAGELAGEAILPVALEALLRRAVEAANDNAGRVRLNVAPGLPSVRWPPEATVQALSQLVRNALEASDDASVVAIRATAAGEGVFVEIADAGSGMTEDILARVGEPFLTTRPGQGTGLGVFVARSLVERMGGRLQFQSARGEGTTVQIWLPLVLQP